MLDQDEYADRITGCLVGLAVADALGLPREGLSPGRARRLFGDAPLRHRLVFGKGMASDDTEHHCMTAQALLAAPDPARSAPLAYHSVRASVTDPPALTNTPASVWPETMVFVIVIA